MDAVSILNENTGQHSHSLRHKAVETAISTMHSQKRLYKRIVWKKDSSAAQLEIRSNCNKAVTDTKLPAPRSDQLATHSYSLRSHTLRPGASGFWHQPADKPFTAQHHSRSQVAHLDPYANMVVSFALSQRLDRLGLLGDTQQQHRTAHSGGGGGNCQIALQCCNRCKPCQFHPRSLEVSMRISWRVLLLQFLSKVESRDCSCSRSKAGEREGNATGRYT